MLREIRILPFLLFGALVVTAQVQPDPRVLVKQAGAVANDLLQWDGTKWAPGRTDVAVVADSAAFRAFNVAIAPKLIVMTDSLRGGKFRRCYSCSADQYMTFSDALSRKWERFDFKAVSVKWYGAKGNGTYNDSLGVQLALNSTYDVFFPPGTYKIAQHTVTNPKRVWGNAVILNQVTVTTNTTRVFSILGDNITIEGFTINGQITTQSNEQSHGVFIDSRKNITIKNVTVNNVRGDGFYVGGYTGLSSDVRIENCRATNALRNGLSIVDGTNVIVQNFSCSQIGLAGIDLETDITDQQGINIKIDGFTGPSIWLGAHLGQANTNLEVNNFVVDGSLIGSTPAYTTGVASSKFGIQIREGDQVTFRNGIIKNTRSEAIKMANATVSSNRVLFENVDIYNCNTELFGGAGARYINVETSPNETLYRNCKITGRSPIQSVGHVINVTYEKCRIDSFQTPFNAPKNLKIDGSWIRSSSHMFYVPIGDITVNNSQIYTPSNMFVPDAGQAKTDTIKISVRNSNLNVGEVCSAAHLLKIGFSNNIVAGSRFQYATNGMVVKSDKLMKKAAGAIAITIPYWLRNNEGFEFLDSIKNGVTTLTAPFTGGGSYFATNASNSYLMASDGSVFYPSIYSSTIPTVIAEPANQVVYGTGIGVTSSSALKRVVSGVRTSIRNETTNGEIAFGTDFGGSVADRMIMLTNGTVGIGTITPNNNYILDVASDARIRGTMVVGGALSPSLTSYSNVSARDASSRSAQFFGYYNGSFDAAVYGSIFDAPTGNLYVGDVSSGVPDAANSIVLNRQGSGQTFFGLGTATPSTKFHLNGDMRVTGAFKDSNNDAGTSGQVLSSTATGTDWIAPPSGVIDLTVTGTSSPLTLNSSNGTDVTITAGTEMSLTGTISNITINNTQTEVNGIYTGSGTVPSGTTATLTNTFTIAGTDATGTQTPKFRVTATGTDPGVQVWKVGNDSLQLSYIGGEATFEAIGTSGDFWINSIGNDLRLGNGSTGVFTHTTKNVLGGYLAVPYVQTASSITVSEGTAEVDVVGTAGTITLTFDNTSNLLGSAAKTITVRNRGAFNVTLSRGSQSWQWSDFTGTNTASDQTLAPGETAKMLWVDAGVTDYYVLHKMPATFAGSPANLAISGTSSPLTVTNSNGTGFTLTAGTNLTLSGTSGNVTINATTQQAYTTVQEEGSSVTQRTLLNFVGSTATAADNTTKTDITFDSDVNALASTATTGLYTVTGTGASATRTITAPASGISISNGDGVSGNPTLALANDLSAVEGLSANGVAVRTGTDTWAVRTITAGTGISISNGDGVSGNPTISSTAGGETVISPSSLSTDQNNWNPTDLSTATIIRMTSSVNLLMITGITAPAAAKKLVLVNIGSNTFILTAQDVNSSAANRFQMTSDFPLYPGTSVTILYDLTSAVWRILEQDRDTKSQRGREFGVEWVAMGSTAPQGCSLFTSNTSVGNPSATLNAGQDLSPGAGSYSYALIGAPSSPTVTPFFVSSSSRTSSVHDFTITTPSSLSNATDSYSLSFGIFNDQIASEPDGVYLFYNHSVNSGKWLGYTNGNSTSTIDTGVTVAASTTYQLRVIIRPDGSVAYFIDDVYVGKTTTNIPAGQGMFGGARINKLAGTSRTLVYRYINARQIR